MIIRGICCLRPGLQGVSENIRVISIVGRFLEHARAYAFHDGSGKSEADEKVYLSSADLMQRNLDRRVETLFPLREKRHREKVRHILDLQLADTANAWELRPDGTSKRLHPAEGQDLFDSQAALLEDPA
jgi:polyphosphate kinase